MSRLLARKSSDDEANDNQQKQQLERYHSASQVQT
jgi:hypothetical protein